MHGTRFTSHTTKWRENAGGDLVRNGGNPLKPGRELAALPRHNGPELTTTTTINPTTGADLQTYQHHTETERDGIFDAAHVAFNMWRCRPLKEWTDII